MTIYFKGLNFIRFVAALLVVIHHTEQFKSMFGLDNYWENGFIRNLGDKGVTLFFVLSGFLITFLLLKEKETSGTINIKYFYTRRILRIWPLYFLIVLSSIFIFPNISFFRMQGTSIVEGNIIPILLLSLAVLPNITLFKFGAIPFSSQAWSIGVEEQFYLIWPLIIKYVKQIAFTLLFIVILMFALQNCGVIINKLFGNHFINPIILSKISIFFKLFRIDSMAIGGIGALLVFHKSRFLNYLYNPLSSVIVLLLVIGLIVTSYKIYFFDNIIYSLLFMFFIINVATYDKCLYVVENSFFNKLGNISYGIYMYHAICIVLTIKLLNKFNIGSNSLIIYIISICSTIGISTISFSTIEKFFMKFKDKFTIIKSGKS